MNTDDTLARLNLLVTDGYLSKHETVDKTGRRLVGYNYTDKCTYEQHWTEDTLKSRGTIYDGNTGEVVALAFPKFFNLDENDLSRRGSFLWNEPFDVFEKVDGSLGIVYPIGNMGERAVATRGSFNGEQAVKATEMLKMYSLADVPQNITLLVEIVYPENRIVVDYGKTEALILLAAYDVHTGEELSYDDLWKLYKSTGLQPVDLDPITSLDAILNSVNSGVWNKMEGFVVRFRDGRRVKIKSPDYLRVHKIKANMSPLSVWEVMMTSDIDTYLVGLPEELHEEVEGIANEFYSAVNSMNTYLAMARLSCGVNLAPTTKEDRKVAALTIQSQDIKKWAKGVLLASLSTNGEVQNTTLLKLIRPDGNVLKDVYSIA